MFLASGGASVVAAESVSLCGSFHTFSLILHSSPSEMFHQFGSWSESALLMLFSPLGLQVVHAGFLTELLFLFTEKEVNMTLVTDPPACPGEF